MNIFENIATNLKEKIKYTEKRHEKIRNKAFFENCLTEEALSEFKRLENYSNELFYASYDTLLKYRWHLTSDSNFLYKENTNAYLVRSDNGFVIDQTKEQTEEALMEEENLLNHCEDVLNDLFKFVTIYDHIREVNWATKPDVDRQAFEVIAKNLGYLKDTKDLVNEEKPKTK